MYCLKYTLYKHNVSVSDHMKDITKVISVQKRKFFVVWNISVHS